MFLVGDKLMLAQTELALDHGVCLSIGENDLMDDYYSSLVNCALVRQLKSD